MKVVVTGASSGVGFAVVTKFLQAGATVCGIDTVRRPEVNVSPFYTHYIADISNMDALPEIADVNILVNCYEVQNSGSDVAVNLLGTINCIEKYALNNPNIMSVLNQSSAAAHSGADFGEYVASKGGIVSYTKWAAKELAKNKATCNSLSFGGLYTDVNYRVARDPKAWDEIMAQTPLKHWCTCTEAAEWVYFFTVMNKSCSGQDLIIDNMETLSNEFIWR